MELGEENESNIFFLGMAVLFGWMFVICVCASPQLFRDFIQYRMCCCLLRAGKIERYNEEKIKQAEERVRSASKSFINTSLTANPSVFLLHQVMGPQTATSYPSSHLLIEMPHCFEPIPEEFRGTSLQSNGEEESRRSTSLRQEKDTILLYAGD